MVMGGRLKVVKMSVVQIELYIKYNSNKNFNRLFEGKIYKLILNLYEDEINLE